MRVYTGKGLGDFYYTLFRDLKTSGTRVTVRGHKCVEMPTPVTLVYEKPGACWMKIPGRRFNPFFALAEVVWILSGNGNAEWIANYNKNMMQFNDGNPDNHGAYGLRMRKWEVDMHNPLSDHIRVTLSGELDQIAEVVRKLREDPCTRQAVISLWDPVRDNLIKSKDYPCNNLVYYKLRGREEGVTTGVLDQTVVIRSNDLVWGQPYNAVQFTHLHALVAGELNADMGTLTYVINNLHYYEDLYPEALGAIEEAAAHTGNSGAECVPGFETVTDDFFKKLTVPFDKKYVMAPGYWECTIPRALRLFNHIKEKNLGIAELARMLHIMPQPLHWLALDFWRGSKDFFTQKVLEYEAKELNGR